MTFFPDALVGSLGLSLDSVASSTQGRNREGNADGVVWDASSSSFYDPGGEALGVGMLDWKFFPSSGLLLPGRK